MGRLLVDGYNVIRRDAALRALEGQNPSYARCELVGMLGHHSLSRYDVVVVFDGVAPAGERLTPGQVKVLHSRAQTADALIANISNAHDVVVTDDRGLVADTLEAGPRVWRVSKLLDLVRPAGRQRRRMPVPEKPGPPRTVKLRSFGVCSRCKFYDRDDWIMLCEEDSLNGAPTNFREQW